jgi:AcrR family transcriptional regulator
MPARPVPARSVPAASRRPRHDADSLLRVATTVFTERGYDGTSMEDLARASGLSKSSIYHHVEGKEQLLRLALERAVGPLEAITTEEPARTGPAIERLRYVVRRAVEVLVAELPSVTLLLRVHGNTATERWALDRRRAFDRFVARVVADAAAQGDVRADVEPLVVTRLLFGMVNSLVEWYRPPGRPGTGRPAAAGPSAGHSPAGRSGSGAGRTVDPDALADAVVRLAFDGLRAPRPRTRRSG